MVTMLGALPMTLQQGALLLLAATVGAAAGARLVGRLLRGRLRALEASEARFRSFVDDAAEGILTTDTNGCIELFNAAAQRMFGYAPLEVRGQHVSILAPEAIPADSGKAYHERIVASRRSAAGRPAEIEARRRDGSAIAVRLAVGEARHAGGSTRTVIVTDLTEVRVIEELLARSQKLEAIGQLAAGIAHEINTPAQYVTDNVRFLEEAHADLREMLELLAALEDRSSLSAAELERLRELREHADLDYLLEEIPKAIAQSLVGLESVARIVHAMREFSHPGDQELADVDLDAAIENAVTVTHGHLKRVADVVLNLDGHLPAVPALEGELNQVLLNLLVNAAHAIEKRRSEGDDRRGTIAIGTADCGAVVEVRIADDGCGIPGELRQRIFDPFFTTKGVGEGTGQGLSLAHFVVVEKLGGEILVESEVGAGSTFTIRLPKVHAAVEARAA